MNFIHRFFIHVITELHPTHPLFVHFLIALTGVLAAGTTGYLDNLRIHEGIAPNAATDIIPAIILYGF